MCLISTIKTLIIHFCTLINEILKFSYILLYFIYYNYRYNSYGLHSYRVEK